ncbi:conserved hypothetical protein [Syntrophobacter sp. SbD1]|nr:conserved hypothetical protein [Syntrophobacter sp. SbD1]
MNGIKLRGIKLLNNCAFLSGTSRADPVFVQNVCSGLAAQEVNLAILTHIADGDMGAGRTSLCMGASMVTTAFVCMKPGTGSDGSLQLEPEVGMVSIFPHEQRPDVMGRLVGVLAGEDIVPYAIASSPSALSVLVPSTKSESLTQNLFGPFEFPAWDTPREWHAAYTGQEQILKEIICSYHEEIIKVYNITSLPDLSFWRLSVGIEDLGGLGAALEDMQDLGLRIPFLIGHSAPEGQICFALCLAGTDLQRAGRVFSDRLPKIDPACSERVAAFTMHGPHFGDRFGIAHALIRSLRKAGIKPLAISCAMSSMSAIVGAADLDDSIEALRGNFDILS